MSQGIRLFLQIFFSVLQNFFVTLASQIKIILYEFKDKRKEV